MIVYSVLGTRQFTYTRKSDGKATAAVELHLVYTPDSRQGETRNGQFVERVFVPAEKLVAVPSVGDDVTVYYNRYGSVETVEIVPAF